MTGCFAPVTTADVTGIEGVIACAESERELGAVRVAVFQSYRFKSSTGSKEVNWLSTAILKASGILVTPDPGLEAFGFKNAANCLGMDIMDIRTCYKL